MPSIAALYKFAPLADPSARRDALEREAQARGLNGVLLIAREGVNGALAGEAEALADFVEHLSRDPEIGPPRLRLSRSEAEPFRRLRVRLKREIVSMGAPDIVRPETVGTYVKPADWNALIRDPSVAVIDTRNVYETAIGGFEGAIDPQTERFRDFPAWAAESPALRDASAVAMFCTGGIRCEKASAHLRSLGHDRVYHLEGGILAYLETVPEAESLWRGQCFVFDERVSVGHGLTPGEYRLCRGCRRPLGPEDRRRPEYREGVCCAACAAETTPEQIAGRRERRRQIALAAARGERHLGRGRRTPMR